MAKFNAQRDYHSDALLLRLKAMFELLQQDTFMLLIYLLFTAFLFCLEFIVVLIKSFSKLSVDEQLEAAAEQLLLFKARKPWKVLPSTSSLHYTMPGYSMRRLPSGKYAPAICLASHFE